MNRARSFVLTAGGKGQAQLSVAKPTRTAGSAHVGQSSPHAACASQPVLHAPHHRMEERAGAVSQVAFTWSFAPGAERTFGGG